MLGRWRIVAAIIRQSNPSPLGELRNCKSDASGNRGEEHMRIVFAAREFGPGVWSADMLRAVGVIV
jgi:hypothetical protein